MTRKSVKGVFTQPMNGAASSPVIENSKLPSMDDAISKKEKSKTVKNSKGLMDDAATKKATGKKSTGNFMPPFTPEKRRKRKEAEIIYEDQVAKPTRKLANESYVVLRMRVQNGAMSVIGSKKVDGVLLTNENPVQGGLTYEASIANARLAIGSVADYGESRSYPRPGEHEHHITTLPSFDFNVKLPGENVALKDLPILKVSLYRFKELVPDIKLTQLSLEKQFDKEVRVVAELNGIQLAGLDKDVREVIKKTFSK